MRILKRIVEMIFIFLVPLMLLLFGLKINKVYDENNNLISQYLSYENGIFREYKDNLQYNNILYYNQKLDSSNDFSNIIITQNNYTRLININVNLNNQHKYFTRLIYNNLNDISDFRSFGLNIVNSSVGNLLSVLISKTDNYCYYFLNLSTSINYDNCYLQYYLYYNSYQANDNILIKNIILIDLTEMFGLGYEPTTLNELINYVNLDNYLPLSQKVINVYLNEIISSDYQINYTWYNNALVSLSEHLQFNNNFMIQFIFIYVIFIMLNLLLWYVFYVPFDMLFGLLLRKLEYYK